MAWYSSIAFRRSRANAGDIRHTALLSAALSVSGEMLVVTIPAGVGI